MCGIGREAQFPTRHWSMEGGGFRGPRPVVGRALGGRLVGRVGGWWAGWAGPGGGGATLRRLCPRLPAEPRRREAARSRARRPRLRHPAAARRPSATAAPRPCPGEWASAPLSVPATSRASSGDAGDSGVPRPTPPRLPACFSGLPPTPSLSPPPTPHCHVPARSGLPGSAGCTPREGTR